MFDADELPSWATLGPAERLVWKGNPSPYHVKKWLGVTTGVTILGIIGFLVFPVDWRWIPAVVVVAGLLVGAYAVVVVWNTVYVVTTEKLYRKRGILTQDIQTVRLDSIQNISLTQTKLQRLVSCGDLSITTAGTGSSSITLRSVEKPKFVNGILADRGEPDAMLARAGVTSVAETIDEEDSGGASPGSP
ncbi:PH domain-containing protein [Haloarchaeobius sp. DFWS5]|uniref:PH domain-containing protein n=1 Tax=Haloarchaeobius sp. DFWS5 TaxID=3446114 RepID=UPI003EB9EA63